MKRHVEHLIKIYGSKESSRSKSEVKEVEKKLQSKKMRWT